MVTPTITSLAPLLDRLFSQAEAADGAAQAAVADLSDSDRARMMRSKTDYRDLYARLKDAPLAVSRETAQLLYMLARSSRARAIVTRGHGVFHRAVAWRSRPHPTTGSILSQARHSHAIPSPDESRVARAQPTERYLSYPLSRPP